MSTTSQPENSSAGASPTGSIWQWNPSLPQVSLPQISSETNVTVQTGQWGKKVFVTRKFGTKPSHVPPHHEIHRQVKHVQYGARSLQLTIIKNEPLQVVDAPVRPIDLRPIDNQFSQLASQWQAETAMLSALSQKVLHPAYQRIIGMGEPVIPLILHELEHEPNHWFWALKAITGANPIKPEHRGRIKQMAKDWLNWGRDHGYCK